MIKPTIGRQVWFWKEGSRYGVGQPEAATVAYVHNDRLITLQVIGHDARARPETSIQLRQPGDPEIASDVRIDSPFAEWMPYQVGQAARAGSAS